MLDLSPMKFYTIPMSLIHTDWRTLTVTVWDLETTNLFDNPSDPHLPRITQFACVTSKLIGDEVVILDEQNQMFNPGMPIPQKAAEYTGITDELVADMPSVLDMRDDGMTWLEWIVRCITQSDLMAGHNVIDYDYEVLKCEAERGGMTLDINHPIFDTLVMFKRHARKRQSVALLKAAMSVGCGRSVASGETKAHNALVDVLMNTDLLWEMRKSIVPEYTLGKAMESQLKAYVRFAEKKKKRRKS